MNMFSLFNHAGFLVPSVEKAAKFLADCGYFVGPVEEFDGEGTREVYVGEEFYSGRLLLLEAFKDGAYLRAMKKRGPGLHHLAIDVKNLTEFIQGLSKWFLHPQSLRTIEESRTAWLVRPGVGTLIEVQENLSLEIKGENHLKFFVTMIEFLGASSDLFEPLGLEGCVVEGESDVFCTLLKQRFSFSDWL